MWGDYLARWATEEGEACFGGVRVQGKEGGVWGDLRSDVAGVTPGKNCSINPYWGVLGF